jgi:hypothetical protein
VLCGQIHPVQFHQERERTFRYNSDKYNTEWNTEKNNVLRIRCKTAKEAGNQYTITIIPHFLLSGCLVRADDVFNTGMNAAIRGDIEKACINMGVLDRRTARKHLSRFDACLTDFVISLAATISEFGENLPDRKPGESNHAEKNTSWFRELVSVIISIRERLFGFENLCEKDIAALFHFFIHHSYPAATCTNAGYKIFLIFLRSPP